MRENKKIKIELIFFPLKPHEIEIKLYWDFFGDTFIINAEVYRDSKS